MNGRTAFIIAGAAAGTVTGIFGAGGGLILVPVLSFVFPDENHQIFSASIAIMLPVCFVSLVLSGINDSSILLLSTPYMIGGAAGGLIAGSFGRKIPQLWLHRVLGLIIIYGGIRYIGG